MKSTSAVFGLVALALGFGLALPATASAAPAPITVKPNTISMPLRTTGFLQGGKAGDEFSLLSVVTSKSSTGEKVVLNYGDRFGKSVKGEPGYFQIALDKAGQRITIDLSQVTTTGIVPEQLKKVLAASQFVASSEMTMDPHDLSTNITLMLKQPVELTVATEAGAKSKLIIELRRIGNQ